MKTKTWVISQLEVKNHEDDLDLVVYTVHYRRQATEQVKDKTYFAESYGAFTLPPPDPDNFTSYKDLTQQQVNGWCDEFLPVVEIDANLDTQIEEQKNPTTSTPPLPWNNLPLSEEDSNEEQ